MTTIPDALDIIRDVVTRTHDDAHRVLNDIRANHPGQPRGTNYDSDRRPTTTSDPTANAALAPNNASTTITRVNELVTGMLRSAVELDRIFATCAPPPNGDRSDALERAAKAQTLDEKDLCRYHLKHGVRIPIAVGRYRDACRDCGELRRSLQTNYPKVNSPTITTATERLVLIRIERGRTSLHLAEVEKALGLKAGTTRPPKKRRKK